MFQTTEHFFFQLVTHLKHCSSYWGLKNGNDLQGSKNYFELPRIKLQ